MPKRRRRRYDIKFSSSVILTDVLECLSLCDLKECFIIDFNIILLQSFNSYERMACLDASSDVLYLTLNSLIYDIKIIYVDLIINYTIDYM